MPPKTPLEQLMSLCIAGAVPEHIATEAPFMRDLAATQDALTTSFGSDETLWIYAARDVLNCVVQPGGAAGFNQEASIFAIACLDLTSTQRSLTSRMDDLRNISSHHFASDSATNRARRHKTMSALAGILLGLADFPCALRSDEERKIEIEGELVIASLKLRFGLDEDDTEEALRIVDRVFRHVRRGWILFEELEPDLPPISRLQAMVRGIASKLYRQAYEEWVRHGNTDIVPPHLLYEAFGMDGYVNESDIPGLEFESFDLLADLMITVETENAWPEILFSGDSVKGAAGDLGA